MMMTKLKKVLATSSKIRRNRRKLLNLQIQFFSGLIILIVVSVPRHSISANVVDVYMNFTYWVAIPGIYFMNNDDFKSWVTENHSYIAFTNRFFPKTINAIDFDKGNDDTNRKRVKVNA